MSSAQLKEEISSLVLSEALAEKLCVFWFHQLLPLYEPKTGRNIFKIPVNSHLELSQNCVAQVREDIEKQFIVSTRYFINEPELKSIEATSVRDLSLNTSFSVTQSDSESLSESLGYDLSVGLSIPGISVVSGSVGGRHSISKSYTQSSTSSRTEAFSAGINLILENIKLRVGMKSAERCTVIKLNPATYSGKDAYISGFLNSAISKQTRYQVLRQGLLICEGQQKPRLGSLIENYYVLNQRYASSLIDQNSDMGRHFYASLRGKSELTRLLKYLQAEFTGRTEGDDLAAASLESLFMVKLPTYPGQMEQKPLN